MGTTMTLQLPQHGFGVQMAEPQKEEMQSKLAQEYKKTALADMPDIPASHKSETAT